MADYSKYGYSSNLQKLNAPITNRTPYVNGFTFDMGYEVQAKRVKASEVANDRLVQLSSVATADGTIPANDSVVVTTTLTPGVRYFGQNNLSVPYLAIYEGLASDGTAQLYPGHGTGIAEDRYRCNSGFSYQDFDGANSVFIVTVYNNNGTPAPIHIVTQHKYIQNNAGQSD